MKKEKASSSPEKEMANGEYYRLNTKAVDDLVNANEENSPNVSEEELKKYRSGSKIKLPTQFKLLFVKFWFPAAVCFFFLWGLGAYVSSTLDLLVITGLALGTVTDLLTNNVLRFVARQNGANDKYMMVPRKSFASLPLNILHSGAVLFLVFTAYNAINRALIAFTGAAEDAVPLGVEPILFGLFYLAFDSLLIGAKRLFFRIVRDAKDSAAGR